jgi:uncharacterized RmlC-like cupin family protein
MDRSRPLVIRSTAGKPPAGPPTPGMLRHELLDYEDRWIGWVRTDAGLAGGWHHHGDRDSYVYVLRGAVTIESGPEGRDRVSAVAGDLVFNPARVVHREVTAPGEPAELLVVRVGPGPLNVNVDSPDAGSESDGDA